MPKQLLKAKFRGEQLPDSFKKGLNYNLSFERVDASPIDDPTGCIVTTTTKPVITMLHRGIEDFFDNWTDIKPR